MSIPLLDTIYGIDWSLCVDSITPIELNTSSIIYNVVNSL